jgi:hypothetical protein
MKYDTFPGPIFDVKSRYEVRISIYCLCPHHSVRISVRYVDNMMTLHRSRRPSGRPPDDT